MDSLSLFADTQMLLEFRSYQDDAWYDARVVAEGRGGCRLRIKFQHFADDQDEVIESKSLNNLDQVQALRSRFRKLSVQFQDNDCSRVDPGLRVCAARPVVPRDRKFYDAVLKEVLHKKHRVVNGDEKCTCRFVLKWIEGPEPESCSDVGVQSICRVQQQSTTEEELDPALAAFLYRARKKLCGTLSSGSKKTKSCGDCEEADNPWRRALSLKRQFEDASSSRGPLTLSCQVEVMTDKQTCVGPIDEDGAPVPLALRFESPLPQSKSKKRMTHKPSKMDHQYNMDVGGVPYMITIENLEKGISPFSIMHFIHQHVSITCQASVSPSNSSEPYTRGIILLDSKRSLDKLSAFLESSDHIIISSLGRPWVMTVKTMVPPIPETLASIQTFMLISQMALENQMAESNELMVVHSGSEEYKKAKEMKILFNELYKHQCGLYGRLLEEEGKISQKYS